MNGEYHILNKKVFKKGFQKDSYLFCVQPIFFLDVEIPPLYTSLIFKSDTIFLDDAWTESRFAYFWKTYLKLPLSTSLSLCGDVMEDDIQLTPSRRMKKCDDVDDDEAHWVTV